MLEVPSDLRPSSPAPALVLPPSAAITQAHRELDQWRARLRFEDLAACAVYPRGAERSYLRLPSRAGCEAWLICWPPGSSAPLHDHGGASALATMLSGELHEWLQPLGEASIERQWRTDAVLEIPIHARHEVWNAGDHTAYSLHVYTPHLARMTYYERTASGELRELHREEAHEW